MFNWFPNQIPRTASARAVSLIGGSRNCMNMKIKAAFSDVTIPSGRVASYTFITGSGSDRRRPLPQHRQITGAVSMGVEALSHHLKRHGKIPFVWQFLKTLVTCLPRT